MQEDHFRLKIVFTGQSSVGKTTLIHWQAERKLPTFQATIGIDFKMKDYQVGGKTAHAMLWDTVGGERSKAIKNPLFRNSHAVCLCFNLNDRYSFQRLPVFLKALKFNEVQCPLFLVGCQADLEHVVTAEQIKDYASKEGMTYIQTSAKSDIGVTENIQKVIEAAYDYCLKNPQVRLIPYKRPNQKAGFCWS